MGTVPVVIIVDITSEGDTLMAEERGMNARIRALRKLSVETQPRIDMERAKSETETYAKYEGSMSIPELRGQVLYDYFAAKTLYIGAFGMDRQSTIILFSIKIATFNPLSTGDAFD